MSCSKSHTVQINEEIIHVRMQGTCPLNCLHIQYGVHEFMDKSHTVCKMPLTQATSSSEWLAFLSAALIVSYYIPAQLYEYTAACKTLKLLR